MIFFMRLDFVSLLPMVIFRMMGLRVFYLDISPFFMRNKRYDIFAMLGVNWIDHQKGDYASFGYLMKECQRQTLEIGMKIILSGVCNRMANENLDSKLYQSLVYEYVQLSIKLPLELIFTSKTYIKFLGKQGYAYVWMPNTYTTRMLLGYYGGVRNICPRWWLLTEFAAQGLVKFFIMTVRGMRTVLTRNFKLISQIGRNKGLAIQRDSIEEQTSPNIYDCTVAYIPHQGVLYGAMYVKDQFYSSDRNDPFHPVNVTHIELEPNLNRNSVKYYTENNIKFLYWDGVCASVMPGVKAVFGYILSIYASRLHTVDLDLILKTSRSIWMINLAVTKLGVFHNLKVMLVGYDILFPQWMAVACRLKGIKTIAAQERMISAWWSHPLLFDVYLTIGPESTKRLALDWSVGVDYRQIGPVRMPKYGEIDPASMKEHLFRCGVGYEAIVLAMDMHSSVDPVENGRALGNNWRINARFYVDLLRLSEDFPEFIFLLKGKDVNFTKVDYLRPLSDQILARKNIKILDDSSVWTPFLSVAVADIGFARHTSMADEMMALGKPVIFHDTYGFPSQVFDYGNEVTMNSYSQFAEAFRAFKHDRVAFNARYASLRERLFGENIDTNLSIQDILHEQLC